MKGSNGSYKNTSAENNLDLRQEMILADFLYKNRKSLNAIAKVLSYRKEMGVTESIEICGTDFALCPRCNSTIDRDFQAYCDKCGQLLSWKNY